MAKRNRKADRRTGMHSKRREYIFLFLILFLGFSLSMLFFKGMSNYGDDASYTGLVPGILSWHYTMNADIFSLRPVLLFPLALSVWIFGYTDLGAGASSLAFYLGTIVLIYLLGRKIYDGKAGLIAALIFAIFPLSIHQGTAPEPVMSLGFFVTLSVLFFIYGRYSHERTYYWLSGVATFLAALVNPLGYVYVIFFLIYMVATAIKDSISSRKLTINYKYVYYFLGLVTAIIILGFLNIKMANGMPFYEFNLTNSYYSTSYNTTGTADTIWYTIFQPGFYVTAMFPYSLTPNIINNIFNIHQLWLTDSGLFGYAGLILAIYLLLRREKKAYFILVWLVIVAAYMSLGTMSLTHYFPIYKQTQYMDMFIAPFALIFGIAFSRMIGNGNEKRRRRRALMTAFALAVVAVLLITSLPTDYWFYIFNHNGMTLMKLDAQYLSTVPNLSNATLYAPALDTGYFLYYMGYPQVRGFYEYDNGEFGGSFLPNCSDLNNNSYVIIPSPSDIAYINSFGIWSINESWAYNPSECGLKLVYDTYNSSAMQNKAIIDRIFEGNIYYKQ